MSGRNRTSFGHAAFSAADVDDARRGCPERPLDPASLGPGLRPLPRSDTPAGFSAVVAPRPEYRFDGAQGVVDGHKLVAMHELYEVGVDSDGLSMPGPFHSVRSRTTWSWLGLWDTDPRDEPFATRAVWVPATRVAVRESGIAHLPYLCIRRGDRFPLSVRNLEQHGMTGFRGDGPDVPAEMWDLLGRSGLPAVLRALPDPFVELELQAGHLALVCNGYLEADRVRSLVASAIAAARAVRAAVVDDARRTPFSSLLPPPAWAAPGGRADGGTAYLDEAFHTAYASVAAARGLTAEDPVAFHRAFPDQPVPGRAHGVLRGEVPGVDGPVRLAWFTDTAGLSDVRVRGALFTRPPVGPPLTAEVHDPGLQMVLSPFEGGVACWTLDRHPQQLRSDDLVRRASEMLDRHRVRVSDGPVGPQRPVPTAS